jgi:hypothetical protein
MKTLFLFTIILFYCFGAFAQNFKILSQGDYADSSFYHIEKIADNEYWICGEYGILKKIDTLGNISSLNFAPQGQHLLKIVRWNDFVFLSDDNGGLYRYDLKNKCWKIKEFENFKNRCFYDFTITDDGKIILCGGTKAIAKGKKKIPNGFIALSDTGFSTIKKVWGSFRKFVFSVSTQYKGEYQAVLFNGISSRFLKSKDGKKWKRGKSIRGLVHDVVVFQDTLVFCGSKNRHYKEDGLIGWIAPEKKRIGVQESGCIWSLQPFGKSLIGICRNGSISIFNPLQEEWKSIKLPQAFSIYDVEVISTKKLMLVGHGKRIYLAEF